MQCRSVVLLGFVVAVGAMPALAQDTRIMPRQQTMHRSVEAGAELRVFTYATWTKSCGPSLLPSIELLTVPAHGSAELRPGPATVRFVRAGEPDCTGKVFPGLSVWYTPAPGFHGTDKFDANISGQNTISHDTYIIDVK
jgi:hypothetical protein